MQKFSTGPDLLQCGQIAALMVYARQTITDKLFGDIRQAVTVALRLLVRCKSSPLADFAEYAPRSVGNPATEFPARIAIKSSARRRSEEHTSELQSHVKLVC